MKKLKIGRKALLSIALGVLAMAGPGEALAVPILSGTVDFAPATNPTSGQVLDVAVSYAVFGSQDFSGSGLTFKRGSGSPTGLDLSNGIYVYAYEIINQGSTTTTNFSFGRSPAADATSWGYFVGTGFTGDLQGFAPGGINPLVVANNASGHSVNGAISVTAGSTSSLIVYTSHYGPDPNLSATIGGVAAATGQVPGAGIPVPEPGSLLLMTVGVAGVVGGRFGRKFLRGGVPMRSHRPVHGRRIAVVLLLAFAMLGLADRAQADPMAGFTGNTEITGGINIDAIVNYAVFAPGQFPLSGFTNGDGSPNLNATTDTVYAFQVVNKGVALSQLSVSLNGATASAWGYYGTTVFQYGIAPVDALNPVGADVTQVGFATNSGAVNPSDVFMTPGVNVLDLFYNSSGAALDSGQTSALLVFSLPNTVTTSFTMAMVVDDGSTAFGVVPGPGGPAQTVPEPATLLLLGPALLGTVMVAYRRKRDVM